MTERVPFTQIRFKNPGGWPGCLGFVAVVFLLQMWVVRVWAKYQLLEFDASIGIALGVLVILFSAVGWFVVWRTAARPQRLKNALLLGFTGTLILGTTGYLQLNAVLDSHQPELKTYIVESRDCTHSRRRRPRLELRPLDPTIVDHFTFDVPRAVCRDVFPNTRVGLEIKPGFFGTRWVSHFEVLRNVENNVERD